MGPNHTAALRYALRNGNTGAIERSAAPLIASLYTPLLRLCYIHIENSPLRETMEASDLAQDAWTKMLRYLIGVSGDRVKDDVHFRRLLNTAARTLFLDHLAARSPLERQMLSLDAPVDTEGEEGDTLRERLRAPSSDPQEALLFGGDHNYRRLVEALFSGDEKVFQTTCRKKPRRRARYYQAYVLYQLSAFLRDEQQDAAQVTTAMMRNYVLSLNISPAWWAVAENEALARSDNARLLRMINELCDTNLNEGNFIAVLRYEFAGLVNG